MGFGISRELASDKIEVWQGVGKDIQVAQGGFKLTATGLEVGDVLWAGTPVVFNETTRTATVQHLGVLYADAGATDTTYQVKKGHTLKVGDYMATGAAGGKAYAITAIDRTNAAYDVITVGTTIGAATAGDLMWQSTATGATASALPASNGLLYEQKVIDLQGEESITAVIRGTIYARRIPINAGIKALTGLKNIIWSDSK